MGMTQQQKRFLLDRLTSIRQSKPNNYQPIGKKKPIAVVRAEARIESLQKIVDAYEEAQRLLRDKRTNDIDAMYFGAKTKILFGEYEPARKALEAFEQKQF